MTTSLTAKRLLASLALTTALVAGAASAQEITIVREFDTPNYDPHKQTAQATAEIVFMMADTLVSLAPDMKTLHPGLAKSWEVSEDGLTYTFQLRDDVSFCDGKKFTAKDAAFSLNRLVNKETKSPVAWRAGKVDSIEATGDYTLVYKLTAPYSELLYQLTQSFTVMIDEDNVKALGENFGISGMNGTGPFCWGEWTPRDKMVLNRNDAYKWGPEFYANQGPAKVEKVTWQVVPEGNTRAVALMTGQADATYYAPYFALSQFRSAPGFRVQKADIAPWLNYFGFKVDKPTVSDLAVRKAMYMAFNTQALIEDQFFGELIPARHFVEPTVPGFPADLDAKMPKYDVEGAKKVLDDAGWKVGADGIREKDGVKLQPLMYIMNGPTYQLPAEFLQGEMRKIGIDIQIQSFDATVGWGKYATQEFDMFAMGFPYLSMGDALNLYFPSTNIPSPNRMNWKSDETDALLTAGKQALTAEARDEAYGKALTIVEEAHTWLPYYSMPSTVVMSEKWKEITPHSIYGAVFYKGLEIEPAN